MTNMYLYRIYYILSEVCGGILLLARKLSITMTDVYTFTISCIQYLRERVQVMHAAFSLSTGRTQLEAYLPFVQSFPHDIQRLCAHILESMSNTLADIWKVSIEWAFVNHRTAHPGGDGRDAGVRIDSDGSAADSTTGATGIEENFGFTRRTGRKAAQGLRHTNLVALVGECGGGVICAIVF